MSESERIMLQRRPATQPDARDTMMQLRHQTIETNGIRMHVAECGEGPAVLLCHGFPEAWQDR